MKISRFPALGAGLLAAAFLASPATAQVKVYILAGQSNMEGKAKNELLDHQATAPETKDLFAHLRKDGDWVVRDDVFIKYFQRHGGLTIGYGSPGRTGVELEFGTVVGDHHDDPVLLIKTAWGGRAISKTFRPPSAGLPPKENLEEELANARKRTEANNTKNNKQDPLPTMEDITKPYGADYKNMMTEIRDTMANCGTLFPELKGKKLELTGFVWFQGWNDQYGGAELEYASNMEHFIRDVRKDLGAPKLPFVIGVMGQNGSSEAKGAMKTIQDAQMAMENIDDFKGNVKAPTSSWTRRRRRFIRSGATTSRPGRRSGPTSATTTWAAPSGTTAWARPSPRPCWRWRRTERPGALPIATAGWRG
jgi:hypothetical protein